MAKVIDIDTHKDFKPVYRGVSEFVSDKQRLLNKSFINMLDAAHVAPAIPRDPLPRHMWEDDYIDT